MNKKGQGEIRAIIGGIISIFILIIFISAMIPVFQSLTGADQKQTEINKLTNENAGLKQTIANKEIEISQLTAQLSSLNLNIEEKDKLISNLSGQLTEKDKTIEELSQEIQGYKEKQYLTSINNNYFNILNYVEKIENKFYTINLAISLISATLLGIIIKIFGLDVTIKSWWHRRKKEKKDDQIKIQTN